MKIEKIKSLYDNQILLKKIAVLWLCFFSPIVLNAQILPAEIRDKTLYKFEIFEEGIYEINYATLKDIGFNTKEIKLDFLHIYGSLEKQTTFFTSKNEFLTELPIAVIGNKDNVLNNNDKIIFYAAGPHQLKIEAHNKTFTLNKNPYSKSAFVYLVYDESKQSKRIVIEEKVKRSTTETFNIVQTFVHHELNERNLINSGNIWLGERIADTSCEALNLMLPNAISSSGKVLLSVASQARQQANLKIKPFGTPIDDFLDTIQFNPLQTGAYSPKAILAKKYLDIPIIGENISLDLCLEQSAGAVAFLDYATCTYNQKLAWRQTPIFFCNFATKNEPEVTFKINDSPENLRVWNIHQAENPVEYALTLLENNSYFTYNPEEEIHRFVIFEPSQKQLFPKYIGKKKFEKLFETTPTDFLIITHPFLTKAANRLATFRRQNDGLNVKVVDVDDVYDAFGSGISSPFAIQKYISWFYKKPTGNSLKYILLFGDSSYDYLNHLAQDKSKTATIPSYQTNESFDPLSSFVTDDLYGILTLPEDTDQLQDAIMQLGVGRIPATNLNEAQAVVSKLIQYTNSIGDWQQDILFVADDGDFNVHQTQADRLAKLIEKDLPFLNPKRLFIDAFPQEKKGNTTYASEAKTHLKKGIDKGVAIINFTGHGSENGWTAERLLRKGDVDRWENSDKYPVLFTATCEFGAFDNPQLQSTGEEVLLQTAEGAIAVLSATRSAISGSNFEMNRKFYEILKETPEMRLGDLIRETKNNVTASAVKRHFTLLGDPSMSLGIPQPKIRIDSIKSFKDENGILQLYLKGQIDKKVQEGVNEMALLEIYAPPIPFNTLGEEQEKWQATYFNQNEYLKRGKIQVINGQFEVTISIPQAQNLKYQDIKVSVFAIDDTKGKSYAQAVTDFPVLETPVITSTDKTPPAIKLAIVNEVNDSKNVYKTGTYLIAEISDKSDILLNSYTPGHQLIAMIEHDTTNTYFLGDYFYTDLKEPTKSYIRFPLKNLKLPTGNYTITLSASDIWQNKSTANISVKYDDNKIFQIIDLSVFPNPVEEDVNIRVLVNTPAERVVYQLKFHDINGKKIFEETGDLIEGEHTLTINNRLFALDKPQLVFGTMILKKNTTGESIHHTFKLKVNR